MDIKELQEKIKGSYDLTNTIDCQSVISMLLDDLRSADVRLKGLAMAVRRDSSNLKERVDNILKDHKGKSPGEVIGFIMRMGSEMKKATDMSDKELLESIMTTVWGELNMDGSGSAQLEELVERFKKVKELGE